MSNPIAIITGANGGMGREITKKVVSAGYTTIMACRSAKDATPVFQQIQKETGGDLILMELDLASFNSIKRFVDEFQQRFSRISLLINNAGILCHHPEVTEENIERTVGVNYLGHFILSHQLFPFFERGGRVVNMVSLTYKYGKIDEQLFRPIDAAKFNRFSAYSNSKLAFLYFTLDAAEAWKDKEITVNCADPGIVSTKIIRMGNKMIDELCDIFFRPFIKKPIEGASTLLHLALSDQVQEVTGQCFANKNRVKISQKILQHPQRTKLREMTGALLKEHFTIHY